MADQDVERGRRSRVFGTVAEEYARLRPPPCEAAVDWLLPDGAGRVLDLAAGAGTLTALLAARVPEVTAVEPDGRMRAVLAGRCPGATVLDGTAESLPLADGGFDAVVVASAWHWFDPVLAVPEIARVLRPGGRLGVVWNSLDASVPWVADWYALLRPEHAAAPQETRRQEGRGPHLRADLGGPDSPFGEVEESSFSCTRRSTAAEAAALLGTYSRVIMLPAEERQQLLGRAEGRLRERLGLSGDEEFDLPFRSLCWRTSRPADPAPH
ncbi:class I SAM-dependent methyltransferase [Streptomyces sp. NBC_01198]|uniref:class I SAM-dependent methyltransferase n=1 Tax=Streptomyces sp. NBC_01198 TaxID=2903769 RepID=UPI002E0F84E4|nr:class I SAM-dependent methyltransferase [Streptomyces sp. NBC_01198]